MHTQGLDEHSVTQYILHKHHLLDSSKTHNVLQGVNDILALHATSATTPYISLFNRIRDFRREQLDEEFYEKRNLIRLEAMRGTLFITSVELAPMIFQAAKPSEHLLSKWIRRWSISTREYDLLSKELLNLLRGGGKTLPEIRRALPKEAIRSLELTVGKDVYRRTNVGVVLNVMMRRGLVVSEKRATTPRITEANRYILVHEVYPKLDSESWESDLAKAKLVKCYIEAFGPVANEDVAWWTGFSKTETRQALLTIERELHFVRIDGFARDYLMLEPDFEKLAGFKSLTHHSLSLLPYEDPYTKGYKLRDRLIKGEWEKNVYIGGGVEPTILLDGKIVGVWNRSIEQRSGPIQLRFFQQPEKQIEKLAVQKARAIGKIMTGKEIEVQVET